MVETVYASDRPDGEVYLSTVIARMIRRGYFFRAVSAPTAILGTPEDFQRFETALGIIDDLRRPTCGC
jgi:hypothetical protein